MSPDFHYFITLAPGGKASHSLAGAFYLDLPLALAALCLFHWVLKLPLISLFPEWHQERLMRFAVLFRLGPPKRFLLITISLLVGIFSHLLWDSFTHGRGWMVHHVAFLRSMPLQQVGIYRPVYNWLQHLSTIIGLILLMTSYSRWSRTVNPVPVADEFRLSKRCETPRGTGDRNTGSNCRCSVRIYKIPPCSSLLRVCSVLNDFIRNICNRRPGSF